MGESKRDLEKRADPWVQITSVIRFTRTPDVQQYDIPFNDFQFTLGYIPISALYPHLYFLPVEFIFPPSRAYSAIVFSDIMCTTFIMTGHLE